MMTIKSAAKTNETGDKAKLGLTKETVKKVSTGLKAGRDCVTYPCCHSFHNGC